MAKKSKSDGMQDMFEMTRTDIIEKFNRAKYEIEAQIDALQDNADKYNDGKLDYEDRNEVVALNQELRFLDKEQERELAALELRIREK